MLDLLHDIHILVYRDENQTSLSDNQVHLRGDEEALGVLAKILSCTMQFTYLIHYCITTQKIAVLSFRMLSRRKFKRWY